MTRPDYCPVAQEPCQAMCAISDVRCKIRDTHPPKREWVGLTNEDVVDGWHEWQSKSNDLEVFAEIIETKLRSKNT